MGARELARRAVVRAARSRWGFRALASLARADPQVLIEALGPRVNRDAKFSTVRAWPRSLSGFEDLAFLFSSHQLHHAIISMAVDEAAYLHRLVRGLGAATIVEIGRSKGGSTLVLAAAMHEDARLWSYDLHVKWTAGEHSDAELRDALARYGLLDRVEIVVGDSRTAEPPPGPCDLVFVDGDHTYEGVRGDYETWRGRLRAGGHLLFHDAAAFGDLSAPGADVARLVDEIERQDAAWFERAGGAGTLLHFVRTATALPETRGVPAPSPARR